MAATNDHAPGASRGVANHDKNGNGETNPASKTSGSQASRQVKRAAERAALKYAKKYGWCCIPIPTRSKAPTLKNWPQRGTTDQDGIEKLFAGSAGANNIGVVTGKISQIVVCDLDQPDGPANLKTLEARLGKLPATLTAKTGGGGFHGFYKYPEGCVIKNQKPLPGIDIKSDGGQVLIEPSIHPNGNPYKFINDEPIAELPEAWVNELAQPVEPKHKSPPPQGPPREMPSVARADGGTAWGLKVYEEVSAELNAAPPGTSNDALNRASFRLGQIVAGGQLAESTAELIKLSPRLSRKSQDETDKTFLSGFEKGKQFPDWPQERPNAARSARQSAGNGADHTNPPASPENAPAATRARNNLKLVKGDGHGTGTDGPAPGPKQAPDAVITEDFLGLWFVGEHGKDWRFNHSNSEWYYFDGNLWRLDETRLAFGLIREVCRRGNPGKASLGKAATARGAETFAQSDKRITITSKLLDADNLLFGTPGGVFELESGLLRPGRREDYITMAAGADPAQTEDCPRWKEFLNQVTKGDSEFTAYLKKVAGYCLSGLTTEQALFVLIGPGGNGKSLFTNILRAALGSYATIASAEVFAETRNDPHPTGMAALEDKRLITASDIDFSRGFAEGRVKTISGGEDITARRMRQDFYTFRPKCKAMVAANHRPALKFVDDAIKRRVQMLPFEHRPVAPDKNLEAKLMLELPAILRWMANGFLAWRREGLTPPAAVANCTDDYFQAEDTLGAWLDECCLISPACQASASSLFNSWRTFREGRGEKPGTEKALSGKLQSRGFLRKRVTSGTVYEGLTIK